MVDTPADNSPDAAEAPAPAPGFWQRFFASDIWYSFTRSPVAIVAALVVTVLVLASIFAPLISPQDPFNPAELNLMDGFTPPMEANQFTGNNYWLGTDDQGRDIFSTILYGSRISLFVGVLSVLLAMAIGIILGLLAGYRGGWTDTIIMRIADVQLTFPSILIALLVFGIVRGLVPPDMRNDVAVWILIVSIALSDWVQYARTVRGATLVERNKEYVQAARVIGVRPFTIMIKHVLPNVMGPVLVIATIGLALAIIAEATLSFLGVGMPKTTPSLGTLINTGQDFLFSGEWWILFFPAVALLALALSVNLLGDWLRDVLNPKLQ
ncbi:MAG: ABC transporter permease [Pseudomonadota bacterium]